MLQVVQNEAAHLKGHVYAEYKSPNDAWKAWRALRLRWYGGQQIQAELVACSSWDAALCGAFLQNRCSRGNASCNYLHLFPVPRVNGASQPPVRADKQHRDIVQYFENAKANVQPHSKHTVRVL